VGTGDDPVVGAGETTFADGISECLLKGEEVFGRGGERGLGEFGLGLVERDVGNVFLWGGEVDDGLGGWVITPGDYGVEIADEMLGKFGGEGFAVEFGGEAGGEVLKHDEADQKRVAGCPRSGLVAEEAELEREMRALDVDGGIDAGGVTLEEVKLIGREGRDGAIGGGAELEGALETVVGQEGRAEDFGEGAGGVAAEGVHLPQTILRGDKALGEDEVVKRGSAEVGNAVVVALDSDGCSEAGNGDGAVELGEGVMQGLPDPISCSDETDDNDKDDESREDDDGAAEDASTSGLQRSLFGGEGLVWNDFGIGEMRQTHGLVASVNGAGGDGQRVLAE
jgi:hypothetical protein